MFKEINIFFHKRLGFTSEDINRGHCYHWAMIAFLITGKDCNLATVRDYGGHAFLYKDGKFFDSQTLDGVYDWRDLPFFDDYSLYYEEVEFQDKYEFINFWSDVGKNFWREDLIKDGIKLVTAPNLKR